MRRGLIYIAVVFSLTACGLSYLCAQTEGPGLQSPEAETPPVKAPGIEEPEAEPPLVKTPEPEAPFVYKTEGKQDPFFPLVSRDGKLLVTYGVINSINDVILEGVIYDPQGESVVVLNDLILKENDQIGGVKVKKIGVDKVILIYENEEYTFKLKE